MRSLSPGTLAECASAAMSASRVSMMVCAFMRASAGCVSVVAAAAAAALAWSLPGCASHPSPLLTSLTVALIVFTPLKLYIPGYGEAIVTKELRQLKLRTDSLETAMKYKDQYLMNMKSVLQGDASVKLDTTMLAIPAPEHIDD